jgi:hypothetical protein
MAAMRTARGALVGIALAATLVAGACSSGSTSTSSGAPPSTGASTTGGGSGASTGSGAGTTPGSAAGASSKFAGFNDPTYAQGQNWLCGPGIATDDRCLRADLDRTVVKADGSTEQKSSPAASTPSFDCFYGACQIVCVSA